MIEITENKLSGLAEHVEKALMHLGKVMHCVSELEEVGASEEENTTTERYGHRYHRDSYGDYDEGRAGYRSSGRYSRY